MLRMTRLLLVGWIWFGLGDLRAADWPHWLGPLGNGSSPETGLLTAWPTTGPKVLWKTNGGDGYSSVAVVGQRAFTLVQHDGAEAAIALDAVKGTELWRTKLGPAYKNNYGNGPRSTPCIDGRFVYVQSVTGLLACLEVASGKIVWQHHLLKEFGAKNLTWGLSASAVIDGDLVLALPGAKGAGVAAFHKSTGQLVWKLGDDKAAYASPVVLTGGGRKQYLFFNASGLLAASPEGQELWRVAWKTDFDCNIATPQVIGDKLFVSSGEGVGCALFQLKEQGPPGIVWESRGPKSNMVNYWATPVVHQGHLYGLSGQFDKRIDLHCLEVATGKLKWAKPGFGKASVTLADGHLFLTTKKGELVLVRASPEKYEEKARIKLLGDNRTVPTIANRRLYLRDRQHIFCLDLAGPGKPN